jgi:hypothetical protein
MTVVTPVLATLFRHVISRAANDVWNTSTALLEGASEEDRERVLRAANERWGVRHKVPGEPPDALEYWRENFAANLRLAHSGMLGLLEFAVHDAKRFVRSAFAPHEDTRDVRTIAEQFIDRVHGLMRLNPDAPAVERFERASADVLDEVPPGYRRKVLQEVLDRESTVAVAETGQTHSFVAAVEAEREANRQVLERAFGLTPNNRRH